jgi:AcrR family transcriptional regulator
VTDTRRKLLDGTIATLRDRGIAGTSARAIAASAGVNQALVFYHFGSVTELIDAACRESATEQVAQYQPLFRQVSSLGELLALGRELHARQRGAGNVTVLAQVLAGARTDPGLAAAARHALALWVAEVEKTLQRLLSASPIGELADAAGLARAVAAAFVGIELYEGADPDGADAAFVALGQLASLAEVLDDLGPAARRALRHRARRTGTAGPPKAHPGGSPG